jgi:hypothetical protein
MQNIITVVLRENEYGNYESVLQDFESVEARDKWVEEQTMEWGLIQVERNKLGLSPLKWMIYDLDEFC